MLKNENKMIDRFVIPLILGFFSVFLANYWISGNFLPFFDRPYRYSGDLQFLFSTVKTMIENSWYFTNERMGYPFASVLFDYPVPDYASLLFLKISGCLTNSPFAAVNLYYLTGYFLVSIITYRIIDSFNINRYLCIAGTIVFNFTWFHLYRVEHLFYTWYFIVPLYFYITFKYFSDHPPFFGLKETLIKKILLISSLLIISTFGVYYTFFGIMLISAGAVGSFLLKRNYAKLISAAIVSFILISGVTFCVAPNFVYKINNGVNSEIAKRSPVESEIYGLKISQMLLPSKNNIINYVTKRISRHTLQSPLSNENQSSSLGIPGAIGFLILISVLIFGHFMRKIDKNLLILSYLTGVMFLWSTIGGFSSLFALFITPSLRGWNRISIFILFACILSLIIAIQNIIKKNSFSIKKNNIYILLSIFLIILIIPEMKPLSVNFERKLIDEFENDRDFIKEIEKTIPDSAVYQIPFMEFPEVPPIHKLPDYGLGIGFIHSSNLKWSYGCIKGREGNFFYKEVSKLELAKQIQIIRNIGFAGIYVDRRGYEDNAKAIEKELNKILGHSFMFESRNKNYSFYKISEKKAVNYASISTLEIMKKADFVVNK